MPTIDEELRAYAVKVAEGRASVSDESRVRQIGEALSKGLPIPEAAAPAAAPPAADPSPKANGRSGMGKGAPLLSRGKSK